MIHHKALSRTRLIPRRHNADAMNTRTLIAIETSLLLAPSLFNSGEIRKVVCV
jgi:hypothetical protein